MAALRDQGLLSEGFPSAADADPAAIGELIGAVLRFLARTPSQLAMINLDDLLAEEEQLNLPGTVETYPNWRRRLSAPLESLAGDPFVLKVLRAVAAERGGRM